MVFRSVRAHAQICVRIDDEDCLEEALQMNLVGARQANSSFARVVHEICYIDIQRRAGKHAVGGVSCPFLQVLVSAFSPSARLL